MNVLGQICDMDGSFSSEGVVKKLFPSCASRVFMKPVSDGYTAGVHGVVGDLNTYPNNYEPPALDFDFNAMIDVADSIVDGDHKKLYDNLKKVFDEPMVFKKPLTSVTKVSQSEKNVEYTFFNDVSIVDISRRAHCKRIVFVNPSKGTLYRYCKLKNSNFSVVLTPDVDPTYEAIVTDIVGELGVLGVSKRKVVDDPSVFYYLSFSGHLGVRLGLTHYLGWEPNPASLGHSGLITQMVESIDHYKISYDRGYVKEFDYWKNGDSLIYPVDFLYDIYSNSRYFSKLQWFMHDMHTSEYLYTSVVTCKRTSLIPYDCKYLVGDFYTDRVGIRNSNGQYVLRFGNLATSCRNLHPCWRSPRHNENILMKASYMISRYGAVPIYLGEKRAVSPYLGVHIDRAGLYKVGDDYYVSDCSSKLYIRKLDAEWEICETPPISPTLSDIVGSSFYCNSTYQTIFGVKYKYVNDSMIAND